MKRFLFVNLIILFAMLVSLSQPSSASQPEPPRPPEKADRQTELEQAGLAIQSAIAEHTQTSLTYLLYETQANEGKLSSDGRIAVAELTSVDPDTSRVVPTEPGLAIARRTTDGWQVLLPGDDGWLEAVTALPDELVSAEIRQGLIEMSVAPENTVVNTPLTGYHLPWEAGQTVWLSQSVGHDKYTPSGSAHYAFDFYIHATMFNIHAAKAGTVYRFKDTVVNDDHTDVNYIVLEDASTSPATYQLYLHLAQDSIPESLKVIGAPVQQGQFIGIADNTGTSTGHHLHFQVEGPPAGYWSTSQDVVFEEVSINGGRPRVLPYDQGYCRPDDVCTSFQSSYVSANTVTGDRSAPQGDMTAPSDLSAIQSGTLALSGWAGDDDSGLKGAQFIAYYSNSWHNVGPEFGSSPFSYNWDLCSAAVPDGPLSLALRLRDNDGNYNLNLPGLRHTVKNYQCPTPPPSCSPGSNQVALFTDHDYGGACVTFGSGSYTSLGVLGDNNAESILVGSGVLATLYKDADQTGRSETFSANDSNLKDNRIGENQLSSLRIQDRASSPAAPALTWPADGFSFRANSSPVLTWEDAGGGTSYEIQLSGPSSQTSGTLEPVFSPGSLPAGNYTWKARSLNTHGASGWSSSRTFTVESPTTSPAAQVVPYAPDFETEAERILWVNSGNWDWTYASRDNSTTVSWKYDASDAVSGYNTGDSNYGDLTSPPVAIPAPGGAYLRFLYQYQTEGPGTHWDRRLVQISEDGGLFENVYQFSEDPPNRWQQGPAIDLSGYAGHSVRVRFHFETVDAASNDYLGWYIDNFSISAVAPPACADGNSSPETAAPIALPSSQTGSICPAGDLDYYRFSGQAGDQIGISAIANPGSNVDTYLYLLDGDGKSVLAENDDMILNTLTNSALSYRLPRDGTYFIKVREWAHPSEGDLSSTYILQLYKESGRPSASISAPPGSTFLSSDLTLISAQISDGESGISHVDFFWHSGNWQSGSWSKIASDWDGSDGWQTVFDAQGIPDQLEMAFYIQAVDWAGNQRFASLWHMGLDRTPPVSSISALPASLNSTVIPVEWLASDNLAGIDHFDLMRQVGSAPWETYASDIDGSARHLWVIAEAGNAYGFKLRAEDRIGNLEAYPSLAERTISIPAEVCTAYDAWETSAGGSNDNAPERASVVGSSQAIQIHDLCNPVDLDGLKDEDWLKITLKAGQILQVHSQPEVGSASVILELYDEDGTTLLAQDDPGGFDRSSRTGLYAGQDRTVYVRIRSIDDRVAGDLVRYQLSLLIGLPVYMPMIATSP